MSSSYLLQKMSRARYKILEDGMYFGEIHGAPGVWAHARNLEDCRTELRDVLEEWQSL
jgi:predicted RNase H-like HicB family nuclease